MEQPTVSRECRWVTDDDRCSDLAETLGSADSALGCVHSLVLPAGATERPVRLGCRPRHPASIAELCAIPVIIYYSANGL